MFWTLVDQTNTSNCPWHTQHPKLTAWRIGIFAMADAGLPLEVWRYPELVVFTGRSVQRPSTARLRLLACPYPTHTHQRLLAVKEHIDKRYKMRYILWNLRFAQRCGRSRSPYNRLSLYLLGNGNININIHKLLRFWPTGAWEIQC